MSQEHDVVIVGSGPAGISTWLHLHDLDRKLAAHTVVIDRAKHPRDKICGGGVTWPGDRQLEFLDLFVDVPAARIHRIQFRFGTETLSLAGDDAIRIVRRREFDAELVRLAVDRGLSLHEGVTLQGLHMGDGGVSLQTSRGQYRARAVVGADGAQSAVRARAGLSGGAGLSRLLKVVTPRGAGAAEELTNDTVEFDFSAVTVGLQGYVWCFPCIEAEQPGMDRGVFDSRVRPDRPRADLGAIFASALAAVGVDADTGRWLSHPVRPYTPEGDLAGPRVVLAGDAAGIDPILGEGISQSLRHGDVAADAVVDAFERDDFSLESYPERFAKHELGRSLRLRCELASELYSFGPGQIDQAREAFRGWLAAGLP